MNENLTKQNLRKAYCLKKLVLVPWVRDCRVYAELNSFPEQTEVVIIRSLEELEKFVPSAV